MRKSRQETIETRKRIVEAASVEFRMHGIEGTGLTGLMAAAGLTHGGFYRHFESKGQIVAEACESSIDSLMGRLEAILSGEGGGGGFEAIVASYLSVRNRDDLAFSCPYASLGSELARDDVQVKDVATTGLERVVDLLTAQLTQDSGSLARTRALAAISTMVGALTLSRITSRKKLSTEILDAAVSHLTQPQ